MVFNLRKIIFVILLLVLSNLLFAQSEIFGKLPQKELNSKVKSLAVLNAKRLFISNENGSFVSDNFGADFTKISSRIFQNTTSKGDTVFAFVHESDSLFISHDNAKTWEFHSLMPRGVLKISPRNEIWLTGKTSNCYVSRDFENWDTLFVFEQPEFDFPMNIPNEYIYLHSDSVLQNYYFTNVIRKPRDIDFSFKLVDGYFYQMLNGGNFVKRAAFQSADSIPNLEILVNLQTDEVFFRQFNSYNWILVNEKLSVDEFAESNYSNLKSLELKNNFLLFSYEKGHFFSNNLANLNSGFDEVLFSKDSVSVYSDDSKFVSDYRADKWRKEKAGLRNYRSMGQIFIEGKPCKIFQNAKGKLAIEKAGDYFKESDLKWCLIDNSFFIESDNSLGLNRYQLEKLDTEIDVEADAEEPYDYNCGCVLEKKAEFPGGELEFYHFFVQQASENNFQFDRRSKFKIYFRVDENGKAEITTLLGTYSSEEKANIEKIFELLPTWSPSEAIGFDKKTYFSVEIKFVKKKLSHTEMKISNLQYLFYT